MSINNIIKIAANTVNVLEQYDFYQQASRELQDEICLQSKFVKLHADTFFYERASQCEYIALLGSGSVRVYVVGDTGREITLYHVKPGETCPVNVMTALLNMDSPAMAVIEVELEAVLLPIKYFKRWISEYAIIRQFVFESFATRMVDILSLMEDISFRKMDQRLANFLSGQFEQSNSEPPTANLTHEKIAVELGSAREVISRLLREFERKGVVELARGRIVRKNKSTLCELVHN